ncbi:hypothetical protein [uncultured Dubosiella sp.]|uniref:hypothetical protein n=1 Tax=uncultured Dubosiella sp. TaxID=1937011 RepID=UPI0025B38071|nr:hypothetical protein [uncultured Dubosiella sp.]
MIELLPANPSGHTQIDGPVDAKEADLAEANRQLVENFVYDALVGRYPEAMREYFDGTTTSSTIRKLPTVCPDWARRLPAWPNKA